MSSPFVLPEAQPFLSLRDEFLAAIEPSTLGVFACLWAWYQYPISYPFLLAALHYWDSAHHVFRFCIDELCPTYEEFSSLLQIPTDLPIAVPDESRTYAEILSDALEISVSECFGFFVGDRLDLHTLILFGQRCRIPTIRQLVVCIVLTADMLLVTGSVDCDPLIITLVVRAFQGQSLVPIILAETLNGLDMVARGESSYFRGSPRLVYMWLLERFRLISSANLSRRYTSSQFYMRQIFLSIHADRDHLVSTLAHSFRDIRWHIPWFRLGDSAILDLDELRYVPLRGLRYTSFYIPMRCLRQFNVFQTHIFPLTAGILPYGELTPDLARSLDARWDRRVAYRFLEEEIGYFPLRRSLVRHLADVVMQLAVADMNQWFWFFPYGFPPTTRGIMDAYELFDDERRVRATQDPVWPRRAARIIDEDLIPSPPSSD